MPSIRMESSTWYLASFSNTSALTRAGPLTAQPGSIKSKKGFRERVQCHHKVHIVLHSSIHWGSPAAVSLSSVWPLCSGCIFWGPALSSQSPLFVLHRLIHFKLLPNWSPLPPFERSLCVPDDLGSIFICAVHMCHETGSCHFSLFIVSLWFCKGRVTSSCPSVQPLTEPWSSSAMGRDHQKFIHTCSMLMSSCWFNPRLSHTSSKFFSLQDSAFLKAGQVYHKLDRSLSEPFRHLLSSSG